MLWGLNFPGRTGNPSRTGLPKTANAGENLVTGSIVFLIGEDCPMEGGCQCGSSLFVSRPIQLESSHEQMPPMSICGELPNF